MLEEICGLYRSASLHPKLSYLDRFMTSVEWGRRAHSFSSQLKLIHYPSPLEPHRHAVSVLPSLIAKDLSIEARDSILARTRQAGREAAAHAVEETLLEEAVVFLEIYRSAFWTQLIQLQSPSDASKASSNPTTSINPLNIIEEDLRRQTPLFARSQHDHQPTINFADIQGASRGGPVVILASDPLLGGCYALVITESGVKHVALPIHSARIVLIGNSIQALLNGQRVAIRLSMDTPQSTNSEAGLVDVHLIEHDEEVPSVERSMRPGVPETEDDTFAKMLEFIWHGIVDPVLSSIELPTVCVSLIQHLSIHIH